MSTSNDPRPLTRQELTQFLPNQRAVRAFEKLFELIPTDVLELFTQIENASNDANTALAVARLAAYRRSFGVDYIDFKPGAPHVHVPSRMAWHDVDDTLYLHHADGINEPVGLASYAISENYTGATLTAGSAVSFAGVGTDYHLEIEKFIADGTIPNLYILGLVAADIPNNEHGRTIIWGRIEGVDTTGSAVSETWAVGDILYCSPTTAGALTNVKPTAPNGVIPIAAVLNVDVTDGVLFVRPTIEQQLYYGAFSKTADATPAVINTAYEIEFDTTEVENGVAIDGTYASRIVVAHAGLYSFSCSFQLSSSSASAKNVWLWFRKNGTDVANSAFKISLESNTALATPSRSLFFSLDANDYIELMWAADSTNVTLDALAATAFAPAAPACVLTVEQIQQ